MKRLFVVGSIFALVVAAVSVVRQHQVDTTDAYRIHRADPVATALQGSKTRTTSPVPKKLVVAEPSTTAANRGIASVRTQENWQGWIPEYLKEKGFSGVELASPKIDSTARWTRLTFVQTFGGYPVVPDRAITLMFDSSGNLENSDINLQAGLDTRMVTRAPAGTDVAYVARKEPDQLEVRWAKREQTETEWIAKDAQTGEILWRKINRRY